MIRAWKGSLVLQAEGLNRADLYTLGEWYLQFGEEMYRLERQWQTTGHGHASTGSLHFAHEICSVARLAIRNQNLQMSCCLLPGRKRGRDVGPNMEQKQASKEASDQINPAADTRQTTQTSQPPNGEEPAQRRTKDIVTAASSDNLFERLPPVRSLLKLSSLKYDTTLSMIVCWSPQFYCARHHGKDSIL